MVGLSLRQVAVPLSALLIISPVCEAHTRARSSNRFVYNFQELIHSRQALRAQYHVAEFTGEREWTIIPAPVEPQKAPA